MPNLIQIKRSLNTANPTSLANGEFAYTANGDVLFIGSNGATVAIGGRRTPGVLTANQALVANATGFINTIQAANAVITSLSANGSYGTAGQVLVSNGTAIFWGTGTTGANTQVQFNDSGVANGSAGFTFDKSTNTLAVANTLTVVNVLGTTVNAASHTVGSNFIANSTAIVGTGFANITTSVNSALLTVGTSFIANTTGAYHTGVVNAASHTVGSNFIANSTAIVGTGFANITTSVNSALFTVGTTFTANSTLVNAAAINVTGQVNTATFFASTTANVGANVQANTTAFLISSNSTVNTIVTATSFTQANTTATPFVANATGLYHTGVVNAASHTVGTTFTANATLVNAAAINITGQTNTTTFFATTSANVGTNVQANTTAFFVAANSTVNTTITATSITQRSTSSTPLTANEIGIYHTGTVNAATLSVGTNFVANTTRVVIGTGVGLQANGGIGTANQVLRSNGTSVFWDDDLGDIQSVTAGAGLTGGGTTGALTLDVGAANGITVAADTVGVLGGSTLTVNSTGVHVNSSLSIQDLTLSGNLVVSGTLTTLETNNLIVEDPLIALAKDQANTGTFSDAFDIGFFGSYGNTNTKVYTGLFRDQSDSGIYKLFSGQIPDPTTTVDTANVNFSLATLQSFLRSSALLSNSTVTNITANSTVSVAITANTLTAGSLSLTTPLAATSGGTGFNTYTSGDIIVANTGNALSKLSLGTDGFVLQSNGTALVYNTLDGGTF